MTGIELIAQERKRQVEVEGWSEKHDDGHVFDELPLVAALYAVETVTNPNVMVIWQEVATFENRIQFFQKDPWPWAAEWDKRDKHNDLKKLTIAGALLAAEIDRRLRLGQRPVSDKCEPKAETANPELAGNPQRQMQSIVMGALFEFLGYLTTRETPITLSARHEPHEALSQLTEFMEKRNLDHKTLPVYVQDWQNRIGLKA